MKSCPSLFSLGLGHLNLPQKLREKDFTQHFRLEIIGWSLKLSALSPTYSFQELKGNQDYLTNFKFQ